VPLSVLESCKNYNTLEATGLAITSVLLYLKPRLTLSSIVLFTMAQYNLLKEWEVQRECQKRGLNGYGTRKDLQLSLEWDDQKSRLPSRLLA
jgi:hypothetical protein